MDTDHLKYTVITVFVIYKYKENKYKYNNNKINWHIFLIICIFQGIDQYQVFQNCHHLEILVDFHIAL